MKIVLNEKDIKVLNDFIQDLPPRYQNNLINWINTKVVEDEVTAFPSPDAKIKTEETQTETI